MWVCSVFQDSRTGAVEHRLPLMRVRGTGFNCVAERERREFAELARLEPICEHVQRKRMHSAPRILAAVAVHHDPRQRGNCRHPVTVLLMVELDDELERRLLRSGVLRGHDAHYERRHAG